MTRFPAAGGGMQMAYTYVRDGYPQDAEEGETLYHVTENRAYVYDGANWIEQTVTDHGELSGVNEGDHRSNSQVSNLAPVQEVNGQTGSVTVNSATRQTTGIITTYGTDSNKDLNSGTWSITHTQPTGIHLYDYVDVEVEDRNDGSADNSRPILEQVELLTPDGDATTIWSGSVTLNYDELYTDRINVDDIIADRVRISGDLTNAEFTSDFDVRSYPAFRL